MMALKTKILSYGWQTIAVWLIPITVAIVGTLLIETPPKKREASTTSTVDRSIMLGVQKGESIAPPDKFSKQVEIYPNHCIRWSNPTGRFKDRGGYGNKSGGKSGEGLLHDGSAKVDGEWVAWQSTTGENEIVRWTIAPTYNPICGRRNS